MRRLLRIARKLLFGLLALAILAVIVFYIMTSSNGLQVSVPQERFFVRDDHGRALILHGVNEDGCVKAHHLPCNGRDMVEKEAEVGFNFVRYLTQWRSIEPHRGEYDEAYLDAVEERLDWYFENGIHVMIDMHVDLYGPAVGGNGHPEWATISEGTRLPFDTGRLWWLNYLSGAVSEAYGNFWAYDGEHAWLQQSYFKMWQKVATRFGDHSVCAAGQPLQHWCLFDENLLEMPKLDSLVRTYPRAVAGTPVAFGFDPRDKGFFLEFEPDITIDAPTEIYLPARRHYPDGWEIYSSDLDGRWRYEWDGEREILSLWVNPDAKRHRIDILPRN